MKSWISERTATYSDRNAGLFRNGEYLRRRTVIEINISKENFTGKDVWEEPEVGKLRKGTEI